MLPRGRLLAASSIAATAYAAYASCEENVPDRYGLTHPYRPKPAAEVTPQTDSRSAQSRRRPRVLVTGFHDWRELESNVWRCRDNPSCRVLYGAPSASPPIEKAGPNPNPNPNPEPEPDPDPKQAANASGAGAPPSFPVEPLRTLARQLLPTQHYGPLLRHLFDAQFHEVP